MKKKYFFFFLFLFLTPVSAYGQSDLFEIRTPNVMIIFDTSSSMNMNAHGVSVSSGNAKGVDGVTRNYQGGGDHPNSKLFIAKQALGDVLKGLENINLGFATYGQRKQEKYEGRYKKWVMTQAYQPPKNWCDKRYYRWTTTNDTSPRYANSFSKDSFKDAWNKDHLNVKKDVYTFDRKIMIHDKANLHPPRVGGSFQATKEFTISYKVTDITYNAEYNWYVFKYEVQTPAYDLYQETTRRIETCGSCGPDTEVNPFSREWEWAGPPKWKTYFSGEGEYKDPSNGRPKKWWDCTTGSSPEVKEKWDWDNQWRTYTGPFINCDKTQSDGWEYVEKCYDVSEYYYPIGTSPALSFHSTNRPHTWSYFRITADTWKESDQPKPYYPAPKDNPGKSDNNFFFINFPEIDDSLNEYKTKKEILKWLDLMPVQNPRTLRWHTKLPLKADSITSNTIESLFTPLADSLFQAKKYFEDYIFKYNGGDAASKSNCRGNYVILMTDGLESARFKGPNDPDYDAAANAAKELIDLVKDKDNKSCGVKTYVIGFGVGLGDKPEVLGNIAKEGGTGSAYFAKDLSQLTEAFKKIFQQIGPGYGRSNPVAVRTSKDGRLYRGYFNLPGWEGHLITFALGTDGNIIDQNNDKKINEKDALWDAGHSKEIDKSARATVYTWDKDKNAKLIVFSESSAVGLKDLINPSPEEDINGDGKKDTEDVKAIIRFILNPGSDGGKYKGSRSPTWSLGDIYHSTPLIVGKPPFNIPDDLFPTKYSKFKEDQKNRPTTIYVGANDGMLHAFDDKDGKERFSVIPKSLLGQLRDIRNAYRFYVDSSPRAYDVYVKKGKDKWLTVLISGLRGGGNYYFALDVTDPNKPEVLWEMTDPGIGYTWSRPEMGRVRIGGQEKFVAFVGGGYSDPKEPKNDNIGSTFYVIDIEDDGKILRKFNVGNKSNKVPAGATAFDKDGDGRIDGVYFGDIQGTLWKIKIDGEEDINKWGLIKLFEPAVKNAIFYPPAVTKNNQEKVLVYFGQGDELDLFEKERTYSFYEIWDKGDSGEKIWEKEFTNKGEKVLTSPAVGNNIIYFTTWQYTGIEADCGAGIGRLYGLTTTREGIQGGVAGLFYDISGKELKNPETSLDLGKGIPSAPVVTNGVIYISTSLNAPRIIEITIPLWGKGKLKSWREVF